MQTHQWRSFWTLILFSAVQQLFNFLPFYCVWSCLFEPIPFRVMIIFLTVPLIMTLLFYFSQEAGQRTFWWLLIKFILLNFIKLFRSFWRSVTGFLSPPLSLALSVFLSLSLNVLLVHFFLIGHQSAIQKWWCSFWDLQNVGWELGYVSFHLWF
jgi:hypothetical protein